MCRPLSALPARRTRTHWTIGSEDGVCQATRAVPVVLPKEKPAEAEVIAVGSGKFDDKGALRPLTVKKGDRVLFGKYSGNEIKIDGVDHLILREDDILGVLEK